MNKMGGRRSASEYSGKRGGKKLPLAVIIAIGAGALLIAVLIVAVVLYLRPGDSTKMLQLPERTAYVSEPVQTPVSEAAPEAAATPTDLATATAVSAKLPAEADEMIRQYTELAAEYDDCIGWIQLDGTPLSYPFFKAKDYERYLNNDRDGKTYNEDGSRTYGEVFLDYKVKSLTDHATYRNWVLYGHNLQKSKTFFNALHNYSDEAYFKDPANKLRMVTDEGYCEWSIAMFNPKLPENYKYRQVTFESDEEFVAYFTRCFTQSVWNAGVTVTPETQVLTLSTCDNDTSNDDYRAPAMYVRIPESVVPYADMMEQYGQR